MTMTFVDAHGDLDETLSIVRRAYWQLDDERQDTRSPPEARAMAQLGHDLILDVLTVLEDRTRAKAIEYAARINAEPMMVAA